MLCFKHQISTWLWCHHNLETRLLNPERCCCLPKPVTLTLSGQHSYLACLTAHVTKIRHFGIISNIFGIHWILRAPIITTTDSMFDVIYMTHPHQRNVKICQKPTIGSIGTAPYHPPKKDRKCALKKNCNCCYIYRLSQKNKHWCKWRWKNRTIAAWKKLMNSQPHKSPIIFAPICSRFMRY